MNSEGVYLAYAQLKYDIGDPIMTDAEFDQRKDIFEQGGDSIHRYMAEAETKIAFENPDVAEYKKVQHPLPLMFTVDKIDSIPHGLQNYVLSVKADGVPVTLVYDMSGNLIVAHSRGKNQVGEDYTSRFRYYQFPKHLLPNVTFGITFEAVMSYEDFHNIDQSELTRVGKKKPADPRSAVAGIFRTKTSFAGKLRNLTFIPIMAAFEDNLDLRKNVVEYNNWLKAVADSGYLGKMSSRFAQIGGDIKTYYDQWCEWRDNDQMPFPADGIIIESLDAPYAFKTSGDQLSPEWIRCVKFPPRGKDTVIESIYWSQSKNFLNPMASIKPVKIEGRTFSNVSLHNLDMLRKFNSGQKVRLVVSGDVIPYLLPIGPLYGEAPIPTTCPFCNSHTTAIGVRLACSNPQCGGTLIKSLLRFTRKFGMKGIGEETLAKLVSKKLVLKFADLFKLDKETLTPILGPKTAQNVYDTIQKNRKKPSAVFISALGYVGEKGSGVSTTSFPMQVGQLMQFVYNSFALDYDGAVDYLKCEFTNHHIPPHDSDVLARCLIRDYNDVVELLQYVEINDRLYKHEQSLYGKVILSGTFSRTKSEISAMLAQRGYGTTEKFGEAFAVVVPYENHPMTNKMKTAEKKGIPIYPLAKFIF